MKATIFFILFSAMFITSCSSAKLNLENVSDLNFYDANGNQMTLIEANNMMESQLKSNNINAKSVTKNKIYNLTESDKNQYVLVGFTEYQNTNVGTKLTKFKKGFKVENEYVICNNCFSESNETNIDFAEGYLFCKTGKNMDCVKTSIVKF